MKVDMTPERWDNLFKASGANPDDPTNAMLIAYGPAIIPPTDKTLIVLGVEHVEQWNAYQAQRDKNDG